MRLGAFRSEQRREPQHLRRVASLPGFEIEQAEVQEQLQVVETETDSLLILGEFLAMLSNDAVGEAQVIVRERVGGIVVNNYAMTANGLAVVFHPEKIIGEWIANLLVVGSRFGAGVGDGRRLENRPDHDRNRDRGNQKKARPAKAQWFNRSRRPTNAREEIRW